MKRDAPETPKQQGTLFAASAPPNPFSQLLTSARAAGLARALRTPVDRFLRARALGDGNGRAMRCGGEVMHGQTLEALMSHAASLVASRPLWMRHPEVRALLTELEGFVGEAQAELEMQALAVPAPPEDEGKLLAWAKAHRIEDDLARRVSPLFARYERVANPFPRELERLQQLVAQLARVDHIVGAQ